MFSNLRGCRVSLIMDSTNINTPRQRLFRKRLIGDDTMDSFTPLDILCKVAGGEIDGEIDRVIDEVNLYDDDVVNGAVLPKDTVQVKIEPDHVSDVKTEPSTVIIVEQPMHTNSEVKIEPQTVIAEQPKEHTVNNVEEPANAIPAKKRQRVSKGGGKIALFLQLAKPDAEGVSRWVHRSEWIGDYASLALGNGLSWGRKGSTIDKMYVIELQRTSKGNAIEAIRLNGLKQN